MLSLKTDVVKVFDSQIKHLAQRSKELDQETRVTVYFFNDKVSCNIYDKDVLRLPSLKSHYSPNGNTALIDGTLQALNDLEETPQKYGDHAFLVYVITDGEENASNQSPNILSNKINKSKDNWTVAVLVPTQSSVFEAKKFGFPANNIQVWDTTSVGIEKVGEKLKKATDNFMTARSKGIKSTKNIFNLDVSALNETTVTNNLTELDVAQYDLYSVNSNCVIKPFIESWTKKQYRKGSAYYQLSKPETVQAFKQICIQNKLNGKIYYGSKVRDMLKLPTVDVKISPVDHHEYDIFIQNTAPNRNLVQGTKLLLMK
jgi:hypothetical protein